MFVLGFIIFLPAILNFVGYFLLWQIDWNFVYGFFRSHLNWNFKFQALEFGPQTANFKSPHWALLLLYTDIYLFAKWKIFRGPSTGWFSVWQINNILPMFSLVAILNVNFRLSTSEFGYQISDIRNPHWAFVPLNRYIFVREMEDIQRDRWAHWLVSLLNYCCIIV